jgi:hypothetical protein
MTSSSVIAVSNQWRRGVSPDVGREGLVEAGALRHPTNDHNRWRHDGLSEVVKVQRGAGVLSKPAHVRAAASV